MEAWVPVSTRIVHFTGYEIKLSQIHLADSRDRKCGHLLGTADLIAQMADRCYLEKCRDRLYPEFVLGGVAAAPASDGTMQVRYSSGLDLLRQTPSFVRETRDAAASTVSSSRPISTPSPCSAARIPTSMRSIATWSICSASCARSAGGCCVAIRPCSRAPAPSSGTCAG